MSIIPLAECLLILLHHVTYKTDSKIIQYLKATVGRIEKRVD